MKLPRTLAMLKGSEGPRQPEDLGLQRVQVGAGSIFRGVKGNPGDEWVLSLFSGHTRMSKDH